MIQNKYTTIICATQNFLFCFSLTNTLGMCYLYSVDCIPADGTLWSTTVQGCLCMSMPTVWAALRHYRAELPFLLIKEDV